MVSLVILPIGLGLLGSIEPCSIGSSLIFIKYLEGKRAGVKLGQVSVFTLTRALFTGLLGLAAGMVGSTFLGFQKGAWIFLGVSYIVVGSLLVSGRPGLLNVSLGPSIVRRPSSSGPVAFGVLFGLNVPACAGPLLLALLSAAGASSAVGSTLAAAFTSLALFGFALSLPLLLAVLFDPTRRALDWLASLSRRSPLWAGIILMTLGLWSIALALLAPVEA